MKENNKFLMIGLGKSGLAMIDYLDSLGKNILAYDNNKDLKIRIQDYKNVEFYIGKNPSGEEMVDQVIISPGVPTDLPFVKKFIDRGIEVIGEVEFAYRHTRGTFVGVTGTNGKTTTTTLLGEFFKKYGLDTKVVGNIGNPVIEAIRNADEHTWYVSELSSFQLEMIKEFKCHIAGFLNLTPDHLNRHGSLETYGEMKSNIFKNQTKDDYAVLNYEDDYVCHLGEKLPSKVLYFSTKREVPCGIYLKEGYIYENITGITNKLFDRKNVLLAGNHNMENVLMAMCMAYCANISFDCMKSVLSNFEGVEHRLEFVEMIDGVRYINDSKGTNPDASVKAVEAFEKNIILIAGGMDKKVPFDKFVETFTGKHLGKVKKLILLGETKNIIKDCAQKHGFDSVELVNNMEEAVDVAHQQAESGDIVLLSPACASWDMYDSYEIRGEDFKNRVYALR